MVSLLDYAALSARIYRDVRGDDNINPINAAWDEIAYTSGGLFDAFTVGAYKSGNDIVIAFKGTDIAFSTLGGAANSIDDVASDLALGAALQPEGLCRCLAGPTGPSFGGGGGAGLRGNDSDGS